MGNMLDCSAGTPEAGNMKDGDAAAGLEGAPDDVDGMSRGGGSGVLVAGGRVQLQGRTRLRDSLLWELQRSFYANYGAGAWCNAMVPNFVTSNGYIAGAYAQVVLDFVVDWYSRDDCDRTKPIYVVEVGTGSGKFGFLLAKKLLLMREHFPKVNIPADAPAGGGGGGGGGGSGGGRRGGGARRLAPPPVRVVLTDFTDQNIDFCEAHPSMQPLLDAGILDLAVFDANKDTELQLRRSGVVLSAPAGERGAAGAAGAAPESGGNPMVVISNYICDTLPQDAFRMVDGELRQAFCTVRSKAATDLATTPDVISRLDCCWDYEAVDRDSDFYGDAAMNNVVAGYSAEPSLSASSTFVVPIGGMRMMDNIARIAPQGRVLHLVGDKGYVHTDEFLEKRDPHIALHGSFSFMVNFDALRRYAETKGGWMMTTPYEDGFKCSLIGWNLPEASVPRTRMAFDDWASAFSPEQFSTLQRCDKEECEEPSLRHVMSLLRLAEYDSDVFFKFKKILIDQAASANIAETSLVDLRHCVDSVSDRYYPLQAGKDVDFELGRLLMGLKDYERAEEYFGQSNAVCGEHHVTFHNIGICRFYTGDLERAREGFLTSLRMKPSYLEAQRWLAKVDHHQHQMEATANGDRVAGSPPRLPVHGDGPHQYYVEDDAVGDLGDVGQVGGVGDAGQVVAEEGYPSSEYSEHSAHSGHG